MSKQRIEWVALAAEPGFDSSVEEQDQLVKMAQRRDFLDWLHEKVNVPRRMAETFSTVYGDVMNTLRDVDNRIRTELAVNLSDEIKNAKKALKDRRYLDVVHFLAEFNNDIKKIAEQGKLLHQLRGEQIDDFYGDNEHFDWNRDYFKTSTASVKTAGIMDIFQPVGRPMAGRILERMYHNTLRERYRNMESLINDARSTMNFIFDRLKAMGAARARGDVSNYLKHIDEIAKRRQRFETTFRQKYETDIKPMVERMRSERAAQEEKGKQQLEEMQARRRGPEEAKPEPAPSAPRVAPTVPMPAAQEPQQLELPFQQPSPQQLEFQFEQQPMDISIETEEEPEEEMSPETAQQVAQAMRNDAFAAELLKRATDEKSKKMVGELLLRCSAALDRIGDAEASLKCLALVEGMLDG
jgi:hypothetical protein